MPNGWYRGNNNRDIDAKALSVHFRIHQRRGIYGERRQVITERKTGGEKGIAVHRSSRFLFGNSAILQFPLFNFYNNFSNNFSFIFKYLKVIFKLIIKYL